MTADRLRLRSLAIRPARQRQSEAVLVASSITKPEPSQTPKGSAALIAGGTCATRKHSIRACEIWVHVR